MPDSRDRPEWRLCEGCIMPIEQISESSNCHILIQPLCYCLLLSETTIDRTRHATLFIYFFSLKILQNIAILYYLSHKKEMLSYLIMFIDKGRDDTCARCSVVSRLRVAAAHPRIEHLHSQIVEGAR